MLERFNEAMGAAIMQDNVEKIRAILREYPLSKNCSAYAPVLMYAIDRDELELVKSLVKDHGVNVNLRFFRQSPLLVAFRCQVPNFELAEFLIDSGAKVSSLCGPSGYNSLHRVLMSRTLGIRELEFLIQHGAHVNNPGLAHRHILDYLNKMNPDIDHEIRKAAFMIRNGTRIRGARITSRPGPLGMFLIAMQLRLLVVSTTHPKVRKECTFPELALAVLKRVCAFI